MPSTAGKNTTKQTQNKPPKPATDFPLFPHSNGQWAKKIKGRLHYFGAWADPEAALARYCDQHGQPHRASTRATRVGTAVNEQTRLAQQEDHPKRAKRAKIKKPSPDFPLYPHKNGQWAKKIRRKIYYFGPHCEPDAALQRYLDEKDDLLAGRTPASQRGGLTLRQLMNRFLKAKEAFVASGELKSQTFDEYHKTCEFIEEHFDLDRLVDSLGIDDFRRLRGLMAKRWGPVRLANQIQRVRSVFKYAYDNGLIERPVRFGTEFRKPTAKVLRTHRASNGRRMFEAAELRKLLKAADPQLKAMILLGINCGFGNTDVATLRQSAVDLAGGWVNFPRPKTGIMRRCSLWPETIKAIKEVLKSRPRPKNEAHKDLVFISDRGKAYDQAKQSHWLVSGKLKRLLKNLKIKIAGLGFYGLRHTFETIGGESRDQVAVNHIMGHAPPANDMASVYRERISDERLKAVTDYIHQWLFKDDEDDPGEAEAAEKSDASSPKAK